MQLRYEIRQIATRIPTHTIMTNYNGLSHYVPLTFKFPEKTSPVIQISLLSEERCVINLPPKKKLHSFYLWIVDILLVPYLTKEMVRWLTEKTIKSTCSSRWFRAMFVIHIVELEDVYSILKVDWFFFRWPIMRNLMFEDVNRLNVSRGQFRIIITLEFREYILIIEFSSWMLPL